MECRIEELVGTPYQEPFGCFALVREALHRLGKNVPDYTDGLPESRSLEALRDGLARHAELVETPQRGDVVLLRVLGQPGHIGIMLNRREMLHSMAGVNACIERLDSVRWKGRVLEFWRA